MNNKFDSFRADPIPMEAIEEVRRILVEGDLFRYTSKKSPVKLLEENFAKILGVKYALAVSSCSAALFLALKALQLPNGCRVMMPAFTFGAVPSAVIHAGCKPVLCECRSNYRIDLEDFKAKLPTVKAVVISHMRGHTSDMDGIMSLCNQRGVPVIEDAAHSLGAKWNGTNIGTLGVIGCFSFQSYKLLNSGEGGILVTNNSDIIAQSIIMSGAYEHNWKKHPAIGANFAAWQNKLPLYNLRMNNISGILINSQLPYLSSRVRNGKRNHDFVADYISKSPLIEVPKELKGEERAPDSIQFNLIGEASTKISVFSEMVEKRGVKLQVFGFSEDNARAFWNWEFLDSVPELPMTRNMLMHACDVRLPSCLSLSDCEFVARAIIEAIEEVAPKAKSESLKKVDKIAC